MSFHDDRLWWDYLDRIVMTFDIFVKLGFMEWSERPDHDILVKVYEKYTTRNKYD